jgi:hypothetical protein
MSEYQYYEFQAIDRPLNSQEMAEVRALSTRATITPTRFVNVYHWGNFKGDPVAMMQRYYDVFLYVANWGSHQLMLRLPQSVLKPETASRYCMDEEVFSMHLAREHVILTFDSETEEPECWDEGEGWLSTLVPLRADIAAGDLRGLYLGWLCCVQQEVLRNDVVEPPLPPGLGNLSAPLQSLVEFLRIDQDLLKAAAEGSPAMLPVAPSPDEAHQWLGSLSDAEKDDLLLRLADGDLLSLQTEVRRRILESGALEGSNRVAVRGRTVGELLVEANRKRQEREQREAQEQERQRWEQAAARAAYLDSLRGREDEVWRQVETLVAAKRQPEYIEAVRLLTALRDLAARQQESKGFEARLVDLRARNGRKLSFLDLLNQAGLRTTAATR